jgi:hypothetical protein
MQKVILMLTWILQVEVGLAQLKVVVGGGDPGRGLGNELAVGVFQMAVT